MKITYTLENNLDPNEFLEVLISSGLGERRPIQNFARISAMVKNSNLIITARKELKMIGVARSITDFAYATYLSDLAISKDYQKQGIGKELIRLTKIASKQAKLILLSAPAAVEFYPRIGMTQHPHCFYLDDVADII